MDVDVALLVEVSVNAELLLPAADVGKPRTRRLLHDVAELSRQDQLALAREHRDLRRQDVAADLRPRHARRHADFGLLLRLLPEELRTLQEVSEILLRHAHRLFLALDDEPRRLAAHMADRALKLAHARFARVLDDHLLDDAFAKLQVTRLQSVRRALASDEVALGDLQLLLLRVARQRDDLHAVAQGARDIREAVRRDDPKDLR